MNSPSLVSPQHLLAIQDLELLARTVVEGQMLGVHRSPQVGSSLEFAQYRAYTQGDDLRFLDWKLYGRTDRLHIKQFQEETNLRATIVLDCSASMAYASTTHSKFQYARALAACLALLLKNQGDSFGLMAFHQTLSCHHPPGTGGKHLHRILTSLSNLDADHATDAPQVLRYLADVLKPRSMVLYISDLLYPPEEVIDQLKSLRARQHNVLVLQVSDPAEQSFPFEQSLTLVDYEDGLEQFVVPQEIREAYLENRREHFAQIHAEALVHEIEVIEFNSNTPLDLALRAFLTHRSRLMRTKGLRRARSGGDA